MRVAIAAMYHETNTFAQEHNDTLDATVNVGQTIIEKAHPKNFIGGFLEGMAGSGVELVPTVDIRYIHGGIVHADVFAHDRDRIVAALREAGPLDAVFFALHGAMAAEDPYTDAEGELLAAARAALGDIPFVATYDFHMIVSDGEAANLAAAFPNDTNPHIDAYEQGLAAAGCLRGILRGEVHPVTRVVHIPIIGPNIGQSTWSPDPDEEPHLPMYQLNQVRAEMEKTPGIVNLTILGGYGYADTPDSSMAVIATADGDADLAERTARALARKVWERRHDILSIRPIISIDEGVRAAMDATEWPVVLVDTGDDPGSACPADSPAVLESLIRHGARDVALTIRDADAVRAGMAVGIGATVDLDVGASIDRRFYEPVRITGVVKAIDDGDYMVCGPTHGGWGREVNRAAWREAHVGPRVVVRLAGKIDVIFCAGRTGNDRDYFKSAGILLDEKKILVVKSNQAHRASLGALAARIIDLASPGVSTVNYLDLPFRHLRRPLWPIDRDFTWDPDMGSGNAS
jgi:microcystin degradation protein MlrC